jgi:predicted nucleic acid-binding protein
MITALDTNVRLDVLLPNETFVDAAIHVVETSAQAGALVICELVYAELCAHFSDKTDCDSFLKDNAIAVIPLSGHSCFLASRIWIQYQKQGGKRTRILPVFSSGLTPSCRLHAWFPATRDFTKSSFPSS